MDLCGAVVSLLPEQNKTKILLLMMCVHSHFNSTQGQQTHVPDNILLIGMYHGIRNPDLPRSLEERKHPRQISGFAVNRGFVCLHYAC